MRKFALVLLCVSSVLGVFFCDFAYSQEVGGEINQTPRDYVLRELSMGISEGAPPPLPKKQVDIPFAAFYLSAQDYLALRDSKTQAQTILYYDVRRGPVSGFNLTSVLDKVQKVQIILGEDFAAVKIDKNLKIYDFKLNRLLTVKSEIKPDNLQANKLIFDNISLYAKAYRNMNTVRRVTRNGSLKTLPMGEGKSLDAFWIESSMSWAVSAPNTALVIKAEQQSLSVKRKNQSVFKAKFADEKYGSDKFRDTLLAFAHHEWPLHPQILQALYDYSAPPKQMEILSYSPTALEGQKQTWVLTQQTHGEEKFPLPQKALGTTERQEVMPLVSIINEAAHNRAFGGMQSPADIEGDFEDAYKKGDQLALWLAGQKYSSYTGRCAKEDTWLCAALRDIAPKRIETFIENPVENLGQTKTGDKKLTDFVEAFALANTKDTRIAALNILQPYLNDPDVPAIILRTAAMARAKLKLAQVKEAGLTEIDAEVLLKAALAKDPYDPKTYVGLAQVLAAKGAYEQSWDIYDALRAGIPTAQGVELKINRVEKNLKKSTPGYFLNQ